MKAINQQMYNERALNSETKYWIRSYEKRWGYNSVVIDMMNKLEFDSVLEAGSMGLPLAVEGETLDKNDKFHPTYIHDLTVFPYPFKDKQFDLFVALQVWEHLGESQRPAFLEAARIAKNVILSFPYKWKAGSAIHIGVDENVIAGWTHNIPPVEIVQVKGRIIYRWEF